jgi:DNA-directed RNA polymerase subunit RPC12/RpoP
MSDAAAQGIACPNCAGMVAIPEGQLIVICPYCQMRSLVKGERGIRRYQAARRVGREEAEKAMRAFLGGKMQVARNAARLAQVQETFLAYLPFWASWARVLGWVFGEEKVGSGKNTRYEPREVKIAQEMDWNSPALDVGEFGVTRISLTGRELQPVDWDLLHSEGMVFEPVGVEGDARAAASGDFHQRASKLADLDRVSQSFTRTTRQRFGLVYYPLWVVRYAYRGRVFQVVVDGVDGQVLYGKAPGSTLFRSAALVAGMAAGALLAVDGGSLAAYLAFTSTDDDALGLLVLGGGAALVGFGLMAGGYRAFRYGEHYEYRRGDKVLKRRRKFIREGGVRRALEEST